MNDLDMLIGYQVQSTADWRREKAKQFPNDASRNLAAAEELDLLAAQIPALEGSQVHQEIREAVDLAIDGELWEDINEAVSAELRSIGFRGGHSNATEFLEWFRDLLRATLQQRIERSIDEQVEEQVDGDPAVQAAKAAYDEARRAASAKAEAEVHATRRVLDP